MDYGMKANFGQRFIARASQTVSRHKGKFCIVVAGVIIVIVVIVAGVHCRCHCHRLWHEGQFWAKGWPREFADHQSWHKGQFRQKVGHAREIADHQLWHEGLSGKKIGREGIAG